MHFLILFSFIALSLSSELETYKEYLVFAAKNHYNNVTDYANAVGVTQIDSKWEQFKQKFNRKYSPETEEERKFNFLKTLQFIESHNKLYESGELTHEVGINELADWSREDYKLLMPSNPMESNVFENSDINGEEPESTPNFTLPSSFDWRQHNKVTPVKNQGKCGASWAFSSTAAIESAYAIKHNKSISLSEQQLIDCSKNDGCNWGQVSMALIYALHHGIELEKDYYYGYRERKESCRDSSTRYYLKISGYLMLGHPATDQQIMTTILKDGPIAVNIDSTGDDFMHYKGGIISTGLNITGIHLMNHYVTAVGWGPEYWIFKNSLGTSWGESGYGKIAKGNLRGFNQWLYLPYFLHNNK